jgi:predicted AAA+ superfamily ATPase
MLKTTVAYQRRIVDNELDGLVEGGIAAISLEGAKATGKSFTAMQRVQRTIFLEREVERNLLIADPERILSHESVLIDEWQLVPSVWGTVRAAVNLGAHPGQFFLTGSASATHAGTHSGAGRIVKVRMRPMTLEERGVGTPSVSLTELLSGARPSISGETDVTLGDYADEILRSGFPGIRSLGSVARQAQLASYVDRALDHDFVEVGGRKIRNPMVLRRWMTAYAAATSTIATYETIRDAASGGSSDKPSRFSTIPFRDALEALFLLDSVPAWMPTLSHLSELATSPKHHLVDPALATELLGLSVDALLSGRERQGQIRDGAFFGALFESLITLNVRVYAQGASARVGHLRLHRGQREIDLIVERRDGRVVAMEVKLSPTVTDNDVKHLRWLQEKIGSDLLDAVVVTTGKYAYRREDGIAVVPAALLGP